MPVRPNRSDASSPLFAEPAISAAGRPATAGVITAHCDGGARGNPGPAGYGVEITDASGQVLAELSEFLGICTNNVAEYAGLLASLQFALDHGHSNLRVVSDSELMVKQIQGRYRVNSPDLKPLWQRAKQRIAGLSSFEITHALRHKNKAADRLANEAMDRGMRSGTPPEGKPVVHGSQYPARPLRATPYPQKTPAPPKPATLDPAPLLTPPAATPAAPAMLRGFARDGVIHILGGHTLPDGRFVKIIPE